LPISSLVSSVIFTVEQWSEADAAHGVLAFVQEIPHALPEEYAFGLLPPAIVASRDWGDIVGVDRESL